VGKFCWENFGRKNNITIKLKYFGLLNIVIRSECIKGINEDEGQYLWV